MPQMKLTVGQAPPDSVQWNLWDCLTAKKVQDLQVSPMIGDHIHVNSHDNY
jgi:hypothetical protein